MLLQGLGCRVGGLGFRVEGFRPFIWGFKFSLMAVVTHALKAFKACGCS